MPSFRERKQALSDFGDCVPPHCFETDDMMPTKTSTTATPKLPKTFDEAIDARSPRRPHPPLQFYRQPSSPAEIRRPNAV